MFIHLIYYTDFACTYTYIHTGTHTNTLCAHIPHHHRSFWPRSSILRLRNDTRGEVWSLFHGVPRGPRLPSKVCFQIQEFITETLEQATHKAREPSWDRHVENEPIFSGELARKRSLIMFDSHKTVNQRGKEGIRKRVLCSHLTLLIHHFPGHSAWKNWGIGLGNLSPKAPWQIAGQIWIDAVLESSCQAGVVRLHLRSSHESVRDHEIFIKEITK